MSNKKNILIVEDEVVIALDIRNSLEMEGYMVTDHLTQGEEVISSINKNRPDLILMDIKLGGKLNGLETAQMIYENYGIPVIFLTSYSNNLIIKEAKKAYPFGYIVKPFEGRELFTNIELAFFKHESELKLKESERKYRELSESIQQIIFECDAEDNITYINEAGMQLLGLTSMEILRGVKMSVFFDELDFNKIKEKYRSIHVNEKRKYRNEYHIINKLGKHLYVEEFISPVYINEKCSGYRGLLIDITSKRIRENLNFIFNKVTTEFEEPYAYPISFIKALMNELINVFYNIEDVSYYELDSLTGNMYFFDPVQQTEQKRNCEIARRVLNDRQPLLLRGADLDSFILKNSISEFDKVIRLWCGFPLKISEERSGIFIFRSSEHDKSLSLPDFENLGMFFETVQSFLDRLSYLRKLRKSELEYKNLVNSISEGILQLDFNSNITFINKQIAGWFNLEPKNVIGKNVLEVFYFDNESKKILNNEILGKRGSLENSFQLRVLNGIAPKDLLVSVSRLINDVGKFVGILASVIDLTDKLEMQRLFTDSERKFKAIFEQAAVGVAILNSRTGKILDVNRKYTEIFGYTKEEFMTMNFMEFTHPDDLKSDLDQMEDLIKGKVREFSLEKRHLTKKGEIVWINLTVSPLWKPDEQASFHIAIVENITQRKLAERNLKASEIEKGEILKAIPDSFVVISSQKRILNSYFKNKEVFIKNKDVILDNGKSFTSLFTGKLRDSVENGLMECFVKREMVIKEIRVEEKKEFYYYEFRFVLFGEDRVLLIIRDITELKKSVQNIQKFFNITEQTKELILITDAKGLIEYVNPTFTEVTGYNLAELKGKRPSEFRSNKHPRSFFTQLWQTIVSGKTFRAEITNKKKNGELYYEQKIITPLINKEGKITNFISTGRDVTQERAREKKIKVYQEFEKILEKKEQKYRTLSLIQGQENERKRLAKELHDSLGQMLTVAKANLEGLKLTKSNRGEEANRVNVARQMLSEIIQETRRISYNLSPGSLYEFGLYPVIKQIVDNVNKNLDIKIEFNSNFHKLRFKNDIEINLFRIIQECIQNTLKHSSAKKAVLNLKFDGNDLILHYKDNGVGFDLKRLSEPRMRFNGLKNIEERAKIIDAELAITSSKNKGFQLKLKLKTKLIKK